MTGGGERLQPSGRFPSVDVGSARRPRRDVQRVTSMMGGGTVVSVPAKVVADSGRDPFSREMRFVWVRFPFVRAAK